MPNAKSSNDSNKATTQMTNDSGHVTIKEIETAIEQLPPSQVDELAIWLAAHRARRMVSLLADAWLERARGAARPGVTTAAGMALSRGEE